MLSMVIGALVMCAASAWLVAVISALSIVGLAPSGQRLAAYIDLGRWRFSKVEAAAGPLAAPHIARYRAAFYVFFASILALVVVIMTITLAERH